MPKWCFDSSQPLNIIKQCALIIGSVAEYQYHYANSEMDAICKKSLIVRFMKIKTASFKPVYIGCKSVIRVVGGRPGASRLDEGR